MRGLQRLQGCGEAAPGGAARCGVRQCADRRAERCRSIGGLQNCGGPCTGGVGCSPSSSLQRHIRCAWGRQDWQAGSPGHAAGLPQLHTQCEAWRPSRRREGGSRLRRTTRVCAGWVPREDQAQERSCRASFSSGPDAEECTARRYGASRMGSPDVRTSWADTLRNAWRGAAGSFGKESSSPCAWVHVRGACCLWTGAQLGTHLSRAQVVRQRRPGFRGCGCWERLSAHSVTVCGLGGTGELRIEEGLQGTKQMGKITVLGWRRGASVQNVVGC